MLEWGQSISVRKRNPLNANQDQMALWYNGSSHIKSLQTNNRFQLQQTLLHGRRDKVLRWMREIISIVAIIWQKKKAREPLWEEVYSDAETRRRLVLQYVLRYWIQIYRDVVVQTKTFHRSQGSVNITDTWHLSFFRAHNGLLELFTPLVARIISFKERWGGC